MNRWRGDVVPNIKQEFLGAGVGVMEGTMGSQENLKRKDPPAEWKGRLRSAV